MEENYMGFDDVEDFEEEDDLASWFVESELGKSIKRVIDEAKAREAIINPVVYMDILKTAIALESTEGVDKIDVKLNPGFKSGSIRVSCKEFDIGTNKTKVLSKLLENASAFSADPRADGGVNVTISFKNLFIDEESQS